MSLRVPDHGVTGREHESYLQRLKDQSKPGCDSYLAQTQPSIPNPSLDTSVGGVQPSSMAKSCQARASPASHWCTPLREFFEAKWPGKQHRKVRVLSMCTGMASEAMVLEAPFQFEHACQLRACCLGARGVVVMYRYRMGRATGIKSAGFSQHQECRLQIALHG
jgi:hypothetical protein